MRRIGRTLINLNCLICPLTIEIQDHIFWDCIFARKVWIKVCNWWGFSSEFLRQTQMNIWKWLDWSNDQTVRVCWGITMAATLWSLWIRRNEALFQQRFQANEVTFSLVKFRTWHWCLANKLVSAFLKSLWEVNLIGAVLSNKKQGNLYLLEQEVDGVGFSDGAFKMFLKLELVASLKAKTMR